jgi:predicted TIM-barrel fold metal-dependent hydrolase
MFEVIDVQVHLPRLVTDWRAGHPRATEADAPDWSRPFPLMEPPPPDVTLAGALTAMDAAGISGLVIDEWIGIDDDGCIAPNRRTGSGAHRYSHDLAIYASQRYPERFSFLGRVDPTEPDVDGVVKALAVHRGLRYLRMDPLPWTDQVERFAAGGYAPVFAAARRHGVAVSVLSSGPELEQYLQQFPDVPVLVDHSGSRVRRNEGIFDYGRYENVALKWSQTESASTEDYPYRDAWPYLLRALECFGRERVLFASDWTEHQIEGSWAASFGWILETDELSASDKEWILGRSARTLLGWSAIDGLPVGVGKYFDCSTWHPSIRISGADDDQFVANMTAHMERWHPSHPRSPELLLARAKGGWAGP